MEIKEILAKVDKDKLKAALEADEPEALKNLLAEEGIDLTDEQLDFIAAGFSDPWAQTC